MNTVDREGEPLPILDVAGSGLAEVAWLKVVAAGTFTTATGCLSGPLFASERILEKPGKVFT